MDKPTRERLLHDLEFGDASASFEAAKQLMHGEIRRSTRTRIGEVLRRAESEHAREAAAYALSLRQANSPAILLLIASATDEQESESVRGQAIEALGVHFGYGGPPHLKKWRKHSEDLLIQLLDSMSPAIRFWACYALGHMRSQRAIPRLMQMANDDHALCPGWWCVNEEAEDALAWIDGREVEDRTRK